MIIESIVIARSRSVHKLLNDNCVAPDRLSILNQFPDFATAKRFLLQFPVDLLLVDLDLAGANFREWYGSLPSQPLLVCLADTRQNVVNAFNLDAVDCVVRPFDNARFRQTIEKTKKAMEIRRSSNESARPYIFVRSQYQLVKIMFEDIQYIAAENDFIRIHRHGKSSVKANITMRDLADTLPPWRFVRIHRTFIVPVDKIRRYDSNQLFLGETRFPVGISFRGAIDRSIGKTSSL
jgi:two-component system LytT family response regulator